MGTHGIHARIKGISFGLTWLFALTILLAATKNSSASDSTPRPVSLDWEREYAAQFEDLQQDLLQREIIRSRASQIHRPAALIETSDRDPADIVLRRTTALLEDLRTMRGAHGLSGQERRLAALHERNEAIPLNQSHGRYKLYLEACRLRREIAFRNPLLDFDRILFAKHHRSAAPDEHMCDQYYGWGAKPGGGLFVLENPFSDTPSLTDLLHGRTVESGRLAGKTLTPGSFLSPDLSYDGESILFAYTETESDAEKWSAGRSYHIFRVNADGSGLAQLTDGPWNDFDPCWLPDGRIAFISERRGGYLRCGFRACPTYTLHGMDAHGGDIFKLSFHETHEWHPSVNHDGLIVYTRWDYVDRDTNVAHHPWLTTPDGRDARAIHGNYPGQRQSRPWMEMDIQAIPGTHRYTATAAPHHGQAYGSLVVFDPRSEDDGAMAPVRRITPEIAFPEAEGGKRGIRAAEVYATAWPLSEDYYLCVYDRRAENYGVYLLDAFGNKELLYRDTAVPCLSPIPLRARTKPPVLRPTATVGNPHGVDAPEAAGPATVSLLDVYDSQNPFPPGVSIHALRIIQVLPKTTPSSNVPRIGVAQQTNARAVLGTVPVEADGSAYFETPARTPVYFQALDESGMAVQSMRSLTYLQPGENLTCQGCHESRYRAPARTAGMAMALRRAPSQIQPEVDGSNPFSYPRLVQPVLDRNCVPCHSQQEAAPDLSGGPENSGHGSEYGWSPSYRSLAVDFGYYFNVRNGSFRDPMPRGGSRTIPGQFGAKASKLVALLESGHHGVGLAQDDLHRLVLWLDCNSDFYGSYEDTAAQSRGEIVLPSLY